MRVSSIAAVIVTVTLDVTLVAHGSSERTDGKPKKQQDHQAERDLAASSGSIDARLKSLNVQNARLESAPPIDHTSSVRLKFDISNDGEERAEDLVLEIVLVSSLDDRATSPPVIVAGPLAFRTKVLLMPHYSLSYDIRFKNISLDECFCRPQVEVVGGRFEAVP